jgi:PAS domain S-box-containing protein
MDPLLDTAPCGFASVADDGTILEINTTLAELLGYVRAELRGWHVQKVLPPGERIFYQTHIFPLLKLHGTVEEIYVALRSKDGRNIPMLLNGVRRERSGAFISDCVFVRVSQRSQYETQLLQARRNAEQANAAKAKFLSMMSHDLRTPLTSIFGHADLLAAGVNGPLNEEQRFGLERIRVAGRELLRMINDILSFAQLESGRVEVRPTAVPVSEAVARAEGLVRLHMDEARLSLSLEPCQDLSVSADPDRLQQILLNLLTNAIKFTPPEGQISVSCIATETRVSIRVRDTGVGIPEEARERIFDPFVQLDADAVDAPRRGVGLGLAISRDLARAMHGELSVESEPGAGSVFAVDLPRA